MSDSEPKNGDLTVNIDALSEEELQERMQRVRQHLGELQAKAKPKAPSKEEREKVVVKAAVKSMSKSEKDLCKLLGEGPVQLTNELIAPAAHLQARGFVLIYGGTETSNEEEGTLYAKSLKHWYRVAFKELK